MSIKIFILALGTRGDVETFLILAQELRQRGHHVLLGTSGFFAQRVTEAYLPWIQIGNGTYDELKEILASLAQVPDKLKRTQIYYQKWLAPQLEQGKRLISALGTKTDYFISNINIGLKRGEEIVPGAAVAYDPPDSLETLQFSSVQKYQGRMIDLVAMNQQLLDPEHLWGKDFRFTGFWLPEVETNFEIPASLQDFLTQDKPPIAITMGSMVMFDRHKFLSTIKQALHLLGQKAIIIGGWSEFEPELLDSDLLYWLPEIPYSWLFPQVSCIIHHGGVGTVAEVLRAGKPSIILPQVFCQQCLGQILLREKLATGMLKIETLTAEKLAKAIAIALTSNKVQASLEQWQQIILADGGVYKAVALIETHWAKLKNSANDNSVLSMPD